MLVETFTDDRCLGHEAPPGYPERPERLRAIVARLRGGPFPVHHGPGHRAARRGVERLHEPSYVERFEAAVAAGEPLIDSPDAPLSPGTAKAAWAAVETVLAAADWAAGGSGRAAFAAVRPPGHHAERDLAMGFCYFNNVAVAAAHLLVEHGCSRVAILDFDVHHGNGTQHLFEERDDVLFVSLHQYPFYPGTGALEEVGRARGRGFTLNVPLAAGTGDEEYLEAMAERVVPVLASFRPDVLLFSAGFDAWRDDPLGGLRLSEEGFRRITARALEALDGTGCERVLSCLEGGYDVAALPALVVGHLEALAGREELG